MNLPTGCRTNCKTNASTLSGVPSQLGHTVSANVLAPTRGASTRGEGCDDSGGANCRMQPTVILSALTEEDTDCKARALAAVQARVPTVNVIGSSPAHLKLNLSGQQLYCKISSPAHAKRFLKLLLFLR